ncbi:uncharacterized protein CANTADRAFT_55471 [Suhomyces tanzawaensis NRRL Y-17324]|uniref:Microtubule binding protein n=1 Tax=Suhomyces tanzawaensis NRRL Y-17324 TaxID=984487 RepID=A0A1E4SE17_9ASCO|nr:uncharacterized protein CANTADRAFT_55471 [Suhomyces tanzawaensis NRRL Y-17324]ODV77642.1 hypothetical protein CANTADRAFT_55471 [Suhomyces tanzawaensis NRRL Y-17324]
MVVGESRSDLLAWLNSTLELKYNRIEECGKGAAFCQLMDCIYGGVPMAKVKFDATTEYDYRQNWKILQAAFTKHSVTKVIDVERLIKCRLQDNLELLQWFKRQWTENKGVNDNYDARARRKGGASAGNGVPNARPAAVTRASVSGSRSSSTSSSTPTSRRTTISSTPIMAQLNKELSEAMSEVGQLNEELQEYKLSAETLETERNFYFNKLREIEILVQNINDLIDANNFAQLKELTVVDLNKKIQTILYSTEEGFQTTPIEDDIDNSLLHEHQSTDIDADMLLPEPADDLDNDSF